MGRVITFGEQVWRAVRQPGVASGARTPGDYDVQSQSPGVWFYADDGARRFASVDTMDLPSEEEFATVPFEQLLTWFGHASVV